ncbi:MFS transporter [Solwaraspora sp. WMMD1047]|uniref:MFS transporter n=1 Tax=Solwaraspora sp. WMMD1047 TaxID=3016102 RepID=UPI0024162F28|nr:MFS transporter [Solwaraspora sp. WMMD1047]MDG4828112.1 MFS transporter [Solwaraspora sp. WMMD1047]
MTGDGVVVGERGATFGDVFRVAEFRVIFAGYSVFLVGETVKMLALSVLIYERTGSSLLAAIAYVAGFLPHALGGVFLLALADRWRPRGLMVGYDLVRLVMVAVLAVGVLSPGAMLCLVFAVGMLAPVTGAVRTALLPDLLAGDAYVLGRSLFTVAAGGTQVLGFAVGGLLIGLVGPYGALWLTAGTCLLSALLIRFGLTDHPARSAAGTPGAAATVAAGTEGVVAAGTAVRSEASVPPRSGAVRETWRVNRELLADRKIRGLLLANWLPGSLLVGAEGVVVPYTAGLGAGGDGAGGGDAAGVLFMAAAFGMLVGDLIVGRFVAPATRERLTPWLALLLGVPMLGFLAGPGLAVAAPLFALATAGFAYHLGLARRFLAAVPERRRGQAFGLSMTGMMTGQGLAAGGAGALAEVLAPGLVMALAGAASVAATVLLWRQLRTKPLKGDDTGESR